MTTAGKTVITISLLISLLSVLSILILKRSTSSDITVQTIKGDSSIKIAVFNGCGRPGIAGMFVEKLRDDGFDVVNGMGENADSFDYLESVVVERKTSGGEKAQSVAQALGIKDVVIQNTDDPYIIEEVAVIIGGDWHTLLREEGEKSD